jgi:hypothetical protein
MQEAKQTAVQSHERLHLRTRAELAILGGFVSSIATVIIAIGISAFGITQQYSVFVGMANLFGISGSGPDAGLWGLVLFFVVGIVWGFIFAFGFREYTMMEGLALGTIQLIVTGFLMSLIQIPQLSGTLLTLPLSTVLALLAGLAVGCMTWGAAMAYTAIEYVKSNQPPL